MVHDVIIIGGGVAGTTAALSLRRYGMEVALIESQPSPQWRIGETLAAEARPVLQSLDLWQSHLRAGHLPSYGNVSCWGWDAAIEKDFTANLHGHAWQLDRVLFESTLAQAADQRGVTTLRGTPMTRFVREANQWTVQAPNTTLRAQWLIDATGRRSTLARHLDVRRQVLDSLVSVYGLARSTAETDKDSRTYIEALPHGWFYTALTPSGRRTVSFQTDADLVQPAQQWRSPKWFAEQVHHARHLSAFLNRHHYAFDAAPELTSAHSSRLEHFSGEGWLAIGDAAMSFDPITGHGLLKAMQSAMQASQAIASGTPQALVEFDEWNEHLWQHYRQGRNACYASEQRWPASPFWQHRHAK